MFPEQELLYSEENWRNCKSNTKRVNAVTVFPPTVPLSLILLGRVSVEEEVIPIQIGDGAILEGAVVAGAEDIQGRSTPNVTIQDRPAGCVLSCTNTFEQ